MRVGITSPIVLDLNGDGVTLVDNRSTNVTFDWDGDGRGNQTGWIGRDDGFLVFDHNGDGSVSGTMELSFTSDKQGAKSDLDGFRAFDSNGDGSFSAQDAQFDQFKVWRDANGNGQSDAGELFSLAEVGIASIQLAGEAVNRDWAWGENITINTGSFTRTNGEASAFGDIALSYDVNASSGLAPVRRLPSYKLVQRHGDINWAAARFSEALAVFGTDNGMDALQRQEFEPDRRDWIAAVPHQSFL